MLEMDDLDGSDVDLARLHSEDPPDALTHYRSRSNTWPVQRLRDDSKEEEVGDEEAGGRLNSSTESNGGLIRVRGPLTPPVSSTTPTPSGSASVSPGSLAKKNSSRKNAWGNMSYADMIAQAIHSSPEQRLTLSQIYEWMVHNVGYFKDKGDSNSSAGWKNSIRHNLSLHNRFVRVQNEGTGKSSWWMINPDAKPGKSTRRRAATMESKQYSEKRRGRSKKNVDDQRPLGVGPGSFTMRSPSSPISESTECLYASGVNQPSSAQQSPMHLHATSLEGFRSRTGSNASSFGRLSPFEDSAHTPNYSPHPPWMNAEFEHGNRAGGSGSCENKAEMVELDSLAHSLRLQDGNSGDGSRGSIGLRLTNVSNSFPSWTSGPPPIAQEVNGTKLGSQKLGDLKTATPDVTGGNGYTLSSVHTNIFSGGSYSSVSDDQANRSPAPFSPPFAIRPLSFAARPQLRPNMINRPPLAEAHTFGPSSFEAQQNGQLGGFPADLEQFMETNQSAFEVDVDEVLNHELKLEGNLDFSFDHMGSFMLPPSSSPVVSGASVVPGPKPPLPRFPASQTWSSSL